MGTRLVIVIEPGLSSLVLDLDLDEAVLLVVDQELAVLRVLGEVDGDLDEALSVQCAPVEQRGVDGCGRAVRGRGLGGPAAILSVPSDPSCTVTPIPRRR